MLTECINNTALVVLAINHAHLKCSDRGKQQRQHLGGEQGQKMSMNSAKDSKIYLMQERIMF